MQTITEDVAHEFSAICRWAFETWVTHKRLFGENNTPNQNIDKARRFMQRFGIILHEYPLLQIAKLHDPAIQGKSANNTIDYIVRFGDWGADEASIKQLQNKLSELFQYILPARNKNLAHNDLQAFKNGNTLGAFPDGIDKEYFSTLQLLVDAVSAKWLAEPAQLFAASNAAADADRFLRLLESS